MKADFFVQVNRLRITALDFECQMSRLESPTDNSSGINRKPVIHKVENILAQYVAEFVSDNEIITEFESTLQIKSI